MDTTRFVDQAPIMRYCFLERGFGLLSFLTMTMENENAYKPPASKRLGILTFRCSRSLDSGASPNVHWSPDLFIRNHRHRRPLRCPRMRPLATPRSPLQPGLNNRLTRE